VKLDRSALNLGQDTTKMSAADSARQHATVDRILEAFFAPELERREMQLLADEVGLGKTFVALAVAYTMLSSLRRVDLSPKMSEFQGCQRAVVVMTPAGNHTLSQKWAQEVEAIRTRCSVHPETTGWFRSRICRSPEELFASLRRASDLRRDPVRAPNVLIAEGNLFGKQINVDLLRFLSACLFRWWGNRFTNYERYQIIRRSGEVRGFGSWSEGARRVGSGEYKVELWEFDEHRAFLDASDAEQQSNRWSGSLNDPYRSVPFHHREIVEALEQFSRTQEGERCLYSEDRRKRQGEEEPAGLLHFCKDVANRRGRSQWYFDGFKDRVRDLYRGLMPYLMVRQIPLVVIDEAHHGRKPSRADCTAFRKYIAPFTRRLLLLTATPFQLHRGELETVLSISDSLAPAIGEKRSEALRNYRQTINREIEIAEMAGLQLSIEWEALADHFHHLHGYIVEPHHFISDGLDPRTSQLEQLWGTLQTDSGTQSLGSIPGALRPFFQRALDLKRANRNLERAMKPLIIRHRRQTHHRRYWIGKEYSSSADAVPPRQDQSQLHPAPGQPIPAQAELVQYLMMKVVAETTRGAHRTTLGMDVTGCYTTLWKGKEGRRVLEAAGIGRNKKFISLLKKITGGGESKNARDVAHPKIQMVIREVMQRWEVGEKSLLFCFRVPTAETLNRLLRDEVDKRLKKAQTTLLQSRARSADKIGDQEKALQEFRQSLTSRTRSVIPLFLDRVLLGWAALQKQPMPALEQRDIGKIAQLCARAKFHGKVLFKDFQQPDRVFLHRAVEHVLASRLLLGENRRDADAGRLTGSAGENLLQQMASEQWVRFRYGCAELRSAAGSNAGVDQPEHIARSSLNAQYELLEQENEALTARLLHAMTAQPRGGQTRILETLVAGPNFFVPVQVPAKVLNSEGALRAHEMSELLFSISRDRDGSWLWGERAGVY